MIGSGLKDEVAELAAEAGGAEPRAGTTVSVEVDVEAKAGGAEPTTGAAGFADEPEPEPESEEHDDEPHSVKFAHVMIVLLA